MCKEIKMLFVVTLSHPLIYSFLTLNKLHIALELDSRESTSREVKCNKIYLISLLKLL